MPTPSQSVSHKWFHQCVNHKKKLCLSYPSSNFGGFSFFKASLLLRVDKVLQKLTKSHKSELRHLLQSCILIPLMSAYKPISTHSAPPPSSHFRWPWSRHNSHEIVVQDIPDCVFQSRRKKKTHELAPIEVYLLKKFGIFKRWLILREVLTLATSPPKNGQITT